MPMLPARHYESEHTRFIREMKERKPELEAGAAEKPRDLVGQAAEGTRRRAEDGRGTRAAAGVRLSDARVTPALVRAAAPQSALFLVELDLDVRAVARWRTQSWNISSDLRCRSARRAWSRWRSAVMSCVRRSSTSIRCQPNLVRTGADSLADLEPAHRRLEVGHGVARRNPAELAALRRASVLGVELRLLVELRPQIDPLLDALDLRLRIGLRSDLVDLDEDVPDARLLDDGRSLAAPRFDAASRCGTPLAERSTPEIWPGLRPRTGSANIVGSRAGGRQPRLPPCSASGASGKAAATCPKSPPERS